MELAYVGNQSNTYAGSDRVSGPEGEALLSLVLTMGLGGAARAAAVFLLISDGMVRG